MGVTLVGLFVYWVVGLFFFLVRCMFWFELLGLDPVLSTKTGSVPS